jgi:hypothetical protein
MGEPVSRINRVAAQVLDYDDVQKIPPGEQYHEYGHGFRPRTLGDTDYDKAHKEYSHGSTFLWVWAGVVQVKGPFSNKQLNETFSSHDNYWPGSELHNYRGRYDVERGVVTVTPPARRQHGEMPSRLVRDLEQRFPEAKRIQIYR